MARLLRICRNSKLKRVSYFVMAVMVFVLVMCGSPVNTMDVHASAPASYESWIDGWDTGDTYNGITTFLDDDEEMETNPLADWLAEKTEMVTSYLIQCTVGQIMVTLCDNMGATVENVVYGRVGTGDTNYFQFGLEDGNIYGVVGSILYAILRNFIFLVFAVHFMWMVAGYLLKGTGKGRSDLKTSLYNFIFMFFLLYAMPVFVDVTLFIRDSLLKMMVGVTNSITGNYNLGVTDIIIQHAWDEHTIYAAILLCCVCGAGIYLSADYLKRAIMQVYLFGIFPVVAYRSFTDKQILSKWVGHFITGLFVPLLDAIGLWLVILVQTNNGADTSTDGPAVLSLIVYMSIVPCRNLIAQLFGMPVSGKGFGLMGAAMMLRGLFGGVSKGKSGGESKEKPNSSEKKVDGEPIKRESSPNSNGPKPLSPDDGANGTPNTNDGIPNASGNDQPKSGPNEEIGNDTTSGTKKTDEDDSGGGTQEEILKSTSNDGNTTVESAVEDIDKVVNNTLNPESELGQFANEGDAEISNGNEQKFTEDTQIETQQSLSDNSNGEMPEVEDSNSPMNTDEAMAQSDGDANEAPKENANNDEETITNEENNGEFSSNSENGAEESGGNSETITSSESDFNEGNVVGNSDGTTITPEQVESNVSDLQGGEGQTASGTQGTSQGDVSKDSSSLMKDASSGTESGITQSDIDSFKTKTGMGARDTELDMSRGDGTPLQADRSMKDRAKGAARALGRATAKASRGLVDLPANVTNDKLSVYRRDENGKWDYKADLRAGLESGGKALETVGRLTGAGVGAALMATSGDMNQVAAGASIGASVAEGIAESPVGQAVSAAGENVQEKVVDGVEKTVEDAKKGAKYVAEHQTFTDAGKARAWNRPENAQRKAEFDAGYEKLRAVNEGKQSAAPNTQQANRANVGNNTKTNNAQTTSVNPSVNNNQATTPKNESANETFERAIGSRTNIRSAENTLEENGGVQTPSKPDVSSIMNKSAEHQEQEAYVGELRKKARQTDEYRQLAGARKDFYRSTDGMKYTQEVKNWEKGGKNGPRPAMPELLREIIDGMKGVEDWYISENRDK